MELIAGENLSEFGAPRAATFAPGTYTSFLGLFYAPVFPTWPLFGHFRGPAFCSVTSTRTPTTPPRPADGTTQSNGAQHARATASLGLPGFVLERAPGHADNATAPAAPPPDPRFRFEASPRAPFSAQVAPAELSLPLLAFPRWAVASLGPPSAQALRAPSLRPLGSRGRAEWR